MNLIRTENDATMPLNDNPNFATNRNREDRTVVALRPNGRDSQVGERWRTLGWALDIDTLSQGENPHGFVQFIDSHFDGVVFAVRVEITGRKVRRFAGGTWGVAATVEIDQDGTVETIPAIVPDWCRVVRDRIDAGTLRY